MAEETSLTKFLDEQVQTYFDRKPRVPFHTETEDLADQLQERDRAEVQAAEADEREKDADVRAFTPPTLFTPGSNPEPEIARPVEDADVEPEVAEPVAHADAEPEMAEPAQDAQIAPEPAEPVQDDDLPVEPSEVVTEPPAPSEPETVQDEPELPTDQLETVDDAPPIEEPLENVPEAATPPPITETIHEPELGTETLESHPGGAGQTRVLESPYTLDGTFDDEWPGLDRSSERFADNLVGRIEPLLLQNETAVMHALEDQLGDQMLALQQRREY